MTQRVVNSTIQQAFDRYQPLQNRKELQQALDVVAVLQPQRVVELGTYRGGTLYCWMQAAALNARLVGVDTPGTPEFVDADLKKGLSGTQEVILLREDTKLQSTVDKALAFTQGPIDFLFIDAEHTYAATKKDWELWSPHVRKDGVVGFHDIFHKESDDPNVESWKVWKEIKESNQYKTVEIIDPNPEVAYGIGLVFM